MQGKNREEDNGGRNKGEEYAFTSVLMFQSLMGKFGNFEMGAEEERGDFVRISWEAIPGTWSRRAREGGVSYRSMKPLNGRQ